MDEIPNGVSLCFGILTARIAGCPSSVRIHRGHSKHYPFPHIGLIIMGLIVRR